VKSFIAALRSLVLPFGATTGPRIVLDGVNGRIVVYNAANVAFSQTDGIVGFKVTGAITSFQVNTNGNTFVRSVPDNGGYLAFSAIPGFGGVQQFQPENSSVPGVTFDPAQLYVDTDESGGVNSRPFLQLISPAINGSPDLGTVSIVLRGQTNTSASDDSQVFIDKNLYVAGLINDGRTLIDTLHIFANGNFDKTVYPNAKRITVSITGGGGGGGGAGATGAGQWSYGDGGGGGEWAQATFDLSLLNNITSYTIGGGGAGGVGAAAGTGGGQTSFNAAPGALTANGGGGGSIRPATNAAGFFSQNTNNRQGGFGGAGGHIRINGVAGGSGNGFFATAGGQRGGDGGHSVMSGGTVGAANGAGNNGPNYGGGGSGASLAQSLAAVNGGNGAPGVIVITIWG
jgi:hypothetical protein